MDCGIINNLVKQIEIVKCPVTGVEYDTEGKKIITRYGDSAFVLKLGVRKLKAVA